ncbi:MAG: iron ABC transporter permease [Alistipes sp.]|nr:iron ABC transporter permease [Rikenellaceae bacterium]MBR1961527.1 iron ABC transporter permease [Alistipes sp.]
MKGRTTILFILLAVLCAVLFVVDIAVGSVAIPLSDVADALLGKGSDEIRSIVLDIRLVRAIVALLAGAALAISGLEMQVLFRNPLAGPYVLGVSAGASLGVALFLLGAPLLGIAISPALQSIGTAGAAWIGSAVVLVLVVTLSRRIKDIMVMLILGIMLSSGVGAVVEILQYFSSEASLKSYVVWTMGSLGDVTATQLAVLAPVILVGLTMAVATIKPMNMLLAGERYAASMGLNISRTRFLTLTSTTLLAGTITAFCGPIGFVGIAVPHIARMLFRSADHRILLPGTILAGVVMLLTGDIVAKLFTLPINTITALMGIPIVVYIVTRKR